MVIFNKLPICKGEVTRHRITKNSEEKATLDYVLGCDGLSTFVETMLIDEERLFTLTKYVTTSGMRKQCMSDHNPLFSTFNLSYDKQVIHSNRREQFNMKNKECQEAFRLETENTNKFTDVFAKSEPFEVKALKFQRCLKQTVQKCFRKIRVRGNERETEVGKLLKRKSKLNIFLQSS